MTESQRRGLPYHDVQERPKGAPTDEVSVWGLTGYLLHNFLFDTLQLKQEESVGCS